MNAETKTDSVADTLNLVEGNMVANDKARTQLHRRHRRPVHAVQRYVVNWGEPTTSTEACEPWYVDATKGGKQTRCRQSDGPIVPMKV